MALDVVAAQTLRYPLGAIPAVPANVSVVELTLLFLKHLYRFPVVAANANFHLTFLFPSAFGLWVHRMLSEDEGNGLYIPCFLI